MVISVMALTKTSLKIGFPLLFLFSFLANCAMGSNNYINSRCSPAANYTAGSKFEANVRRVFSALTNDAPLIGFAFANRGQGPDKAYGLVQCRGDVDPDVCKTCIYNSILQVVKYCPNSMDAIIWYEKCQLRYSATDFIVHLNVEDSGNWYWTDGKVEDPKVFDEKLGTMLKNLTYVATRYLSRFMFVKGYIPYSDLQTIYGLVQCTWDISLADCKLCLDSTVSLTPTTCRNAHGCEIVTGSCRVRYDTQLFYDTTTDQSSSPLSNSSPPSSSSPSPSPSASPPFDYATPVPSSSPTSNGASNTTSEKANQSSRTSVAMITVITFALTSTYWLLLMQS